MLTNKALNGWNLFWLFSATVSVAMLIAMIGADLSSAAGVSSMIQLSVRFAVPWIFLTFAISALHNLLPGAFTRWLLKNRKFFGLVFAATMAWQGFFILWMVLIHTDNYVNEVYVMRDAIEGTIGYTFLLAMTVTSFPFARKRMRAKHWRWLHLSGVYYLWGYAFIVYWWALFYYSNPVPLDYLYYGAGCAAWTLRAAAWGKRLHHRVDKGTAKRLPPVMRPVGSALLAVGVGAAIFGSLWSSTARELLYGHSMTRIPELYLPYWPFEPFLPLGIMGIGIYLLAASPGRTTRVPQSVMQSQ